MNSLLAVLLTEVVRESGHLCGIDTTHDIKTIESRVEHEGESFLTITLPTFFKDLQRALDRGYIASDLFRSFKRNKSELPEFLGDFLRLVFDEGDGRILNECDRSESIDAIRCMFQISGLLKKVELECSPKRVDAAYARFIENDAAVLRHRENVTREMRDKFVTMGYHLFGDVFQQVDREVYKQELQPVHGPGATADKLKGNQKFDPKKQTWPARLEHVFPQGRYGFNSWSNYLGEVVDSGVAVPGTEIPVRVIDVPKTLSTPRMIAIEPTVMQYAQQSLSYSFERAINQSKIGRVMSWSSQVPNQDMAAIGSDPHSRYRDEGAFATLDLSDASDLVDSLLVADLFRGYSDLREAVMAMRSTHADVRGKIIPLAKYASMGSALCFPIESMVFTIIAFLGIHEVYPTLRPWELLSNFKGKVRVYGDDIIVPVRAARSVVQTLEAYGLRVNSTKSFWTGMYRESCGKEYFAGSDVTIAKVKRVLPDVRKPIAGQEESIVSTVALRNNLYWRGYFDTARWLDNILGRVLKGHYPKVLSTSSILGRVESLVEFDVDGYNPNTQDPLVKGYRVINRTPSSKLGDYGALVKTLGKRSEMPIFDPKHLQQAGRPRALRIKLGSARPF